MDRIVDVRTHPSVHVLGGVHHPLARLRRPPGGHLDRTSTGRAGRRSRAPGRLPHGGPDGLDVDVGVGRPGGGRLEARQGASPNCMPGRGVGRRQHQRLLGDSELEGAKSGERPFEHPAGGGGAPLRPGDHPTRRRHACLFEREVGHELPIRGLGLSSCRAGAPRGAVRGRGQQVVGAAVRGGDEDPGRHVGEGDARLVAGHPPAVDRRARLTATGRNGSSAAPGSDNPSVNTTSPPTELAAAAWRSRRRVGEKWARAEAEAAVRPQQRDCRRQPAALAVRLERSTHSSVSPRPAPPCVGRAGADAEQSGLGQFRPQRAPGRTGRRTARPP